MEKVFLLFLDGVSYDFLSKAIKKGVMPNLSNIYENGFYSPLISTIPPQSPIAIPSLFSGQTPGKHGSFGWSYVHDNKMKLINYRDIQTPMIWDILSKNEKKCVVYNIPCTYPPNKVNGVIVAGPPTPTNDLITEPKQLSKLLELDIGKDVGDTDMADGDFYGSDRRQFVDKVLDIIKLQKKIIFYLMDEFKWDFFTAGITVIDRVQHVLYGFSTEESPYYDEGIESELFSVYNLIDDLIYSIVEKIRDEAHFFIVSDHGFNYVERNIGLQNILNSFQSKKSSISNIITIEKIKKLAQTLGINYSRGVVKKIATKIQPFIKREIDIQNSTCYTLDGGRVFVNKEKITDYENYLKKLREYLLSYKNNEGEAVFDDVYYGSELYIKNKIMPTPDIIVVPKTGYDIKTWNKDIIEKIKITKNTTTQTGCHKDRSSRRGIFIYRNKDGLNLSSSQIDIYDVCPTIMHIYKLHKNPEEYSGKNIIIN
ncbi:alkaline phosphatase family protein [Thermoproteota archaeon]